MNKILIVDASASDSRVMANLLMKAGYDPVVTESIEAGKQEAAKLPPGAVIVTAMRLNDGTAREFINWLKAEGYSFPVIAIVENLNPTELLAVMSGGGATDVVQRPAIDKQLVEVVGRYARPEEIVLTLDKQLIPRVSPVWKEIDEKISMIAATNANAIVFGECGTGKEQIARQIYKMSSRDQKPIIIVDAAGTAFMGIHDPTSDRSETYNRLKSYFAKSVGGTMIIKNVHLMTFEKQSVLLHILETENTDVRIICTAEPELFDMVSNKLFRANLFYILRMSEIVVPSLRNVPEDIPEISDFFLQQYAIKTGKRKKKLDASAVKAVMAYPWPGNVRELKDTIQFSAFHAKEDTIAAENIFFNLPEPEILEELSLKNPQNEILRILDALSRTKWNKSQAAKLLGVSRTTLDKKIKKYGLSQT